MSNTPILDKNLSFIAKYNPDLKSRIEKINEFINVVGLSETDLKEPNLTFNGLALHNPEGAEAEAKKTFSNIDNTKNAMHVVFGLGLGYLFQEYALNSIGTVILFEPNIEILRMTLEIVDFSEEFSKKNVFVVNTLEEFSTIFLAHYKKGVDLSCGLLVSYRKMYPKLINDLTEKMKFLVGSSNLTSNYYKNKLPSILLRFVASLSKTIKEIPFIELKDLYKDKAAVIISAGPSLDKNIEVLKQNKDKVVTICVGASLRTLLENDIRPDFVVFLEQFFVQKSIEGLDTKDLNLILETYTNECYHNLSSKNTFSYPSKNTPVNEVWKEYTKIDTSFYKTSGTVSYAAMQCAKILGCSRIILIGQDLAYIEGQCYNKGNSYNDLICALNPQTQKYEITAKDIASFKNALFSGYSNIYSDEMLTQAAYEKLNDLNKNLYYVRGIDGNMIPTEIDYANFIPEFTDFANENSNIKLINTSLKGAQIDGFENLPLSDSVKDLEKIEKIDIKINFNPDYSIFLENLTKEINNLDEILAKLAKASTLILKTDKEYSNRKIFNDTCKKYYLEINEIFNSLNDIYLSKSPIFNCTSLTVQQDMQNALDTDNAITIYNGFKIYFSALTKLLQCINFAYIREKGKINDISSSKS